jgi:[1-hydroxy-2-(trimethylamino)ethyl]phosphonate dioxygenase
MSAAGGCDIVGLLAGSGRYTYGESVSQLTHALQCAQRARHDRADDELIVAALLHDVGHLVHGGREAPDHHHGSEGAAFVRPFVPLRVCWLVDHHVAAKRYLCTVDARYVDGLSPASRRSYLAQGTRLALDEQLALETHPWFGDALRVRRWDDAAKIPDARCAPLVEYASLLERYFGPQRWPVAPGIHDRA